MAKAKFPKPKAPRPMPELNQIYSQMVSKLGENNLQITRLEQQNVTLMAEINNLETEAKESQALEKQVAETQAPKEETPS